MLTFAYACPVKYRNPMGHRIMKKVSTPTQTHTTLYSRDAQGNVLATYDFIPKTGIDITYMDKPNEMMIYGSSRLGVKRPLQQRANSITNHATVSLSVSSGFFPKPFAEVQAEICGNSGPETYVEPALDHTDVNYFRKHINESSTYQVSTVFGNPPMSYLYPEFTCSKNLTHTRLFTGMSEYELTNHLGNVLATVKDEPILTPEASLSPSNEVAFTKKPLILTAQDYYPFGMVMPNRSFSLGGSNYRFGFNTQEKDDEVYGKGNLMTAKFWEYDTRLGRRWNRDPKYTAFESRYVVNSNNPIHFTDPNGDFRTKFFANIARAVDKLLGKEVGDVYKNDGGQFGYAVNGGGNGWGHKFGTRGNGGNGGKGGASGSKRGGNGVIASFENYGIGAKSAMTSFTKFAIGGGGTQTFEKGSFEAEEMAKSPGIKKGLEKLGDKNFDDFYYSFSPSPSKVIDATLENGNPLDGFSPENKQAHTDVFNNQSWVRLYVGGYSGTMRVINNNQVEVVIRNNTTANSLMIHAGELIYGSKEGANKFDNFWNSTPFFNTLKQEYKFIVPKK